MIVAEEGAAERTGICCVVIVDAHTFRNVDVVHQLHVLVVVAVAIKDIMYKLVPIGSAADEVGVSISARAGKRLLSCFVWHNFSRAAAFEIFICGYRCCAINHKLFAGDEADLTDRSSPRCIRICYIASAIDKVFRMGPSKCQSTGFCLAKIIAWADAGTIISTWITISTYGCYLTTIDDDVATKAQISEIISGAWSISASNACRKATASGIDHATIDGDVATVSIMTVTADARSSCTAIDIDGATVDNNCTHVHGTDA